MSGRHAGSTHGASTRQPYQARLLIVELDQVSRAWLPRDVPGISVVGSGAPDPPEASIPEADMIVLLAEDLAAVPELVVMAISRTAAAHGRATAAVITAPAEAWTGEAAGRAMATIRDAVDTVLIVEDVRLAAAFIDVLRGGRRDLAH